MNSDLAELVDKAKLISILTGAGVSTESGIPDFRSPGGIWSKYRIIEYDEFMASEDARLEDWRRRFDMEDQLGEVKPNRGHYWIADLVKSGKCPILATQNIDGLHQEAGTPETSVVELHGNARHANCVDCGERYEIAQCREILEQTGKAPVCRDCSGIIKTAVVMFGEMMPMQQLEQARQAAQNCDLFIAMGSSLVVQPAAVLPLYAKRAGARLAIISREPTELDEFADLVLNEEIGKLLAPA